MATARTAAERPLGLVPTMGALHEGHLSLVRRARSENATLVVTIFVNPTQFAPNEDLAAYPRDLDRDIALLEQEGADLVFLPSPEEIYPDGFDTWVSVDRTSAPLEGESRPGHFRGVATVVCKLFNIVRPDGAYFGQKDAQQLQVIRRMNADLNLGVELTAMPTVREPDGLAMSSRNAHLNPAERRAAPVLYNSLRAARELYADGVAAGAGHPRGHAEDARRRASGQHRLRERRRPGLHGRVAANRGAGAGVAGRSHWGHAPDRQRCPGSRGEVAQDAPCRT